MTELDFIKRNLERVLERIKETAEKRGRKSEEIEVVAVAKGFPPEYIREAINAGITKIGENRVQEAEKKISQLKDLTCEWHMVGHLQKNKVKKAIKLFSLIHSLDRLELAYEIDKIAQRENLQVKVLIQLNLSQEPTKHGFIETEFWKLYDKIFELKNIKVMGLMTIGPLTDDKSEIRKVFKKLYNIWDRLRTEVKIDLPYLSMGMSEDFDIAIEEGANLLRLGRIIFSKEFEVRR
ncbi:MAG: YggS family pyridoxal phosphate-dependent enzyme [Dictyoglomus sp.]